MALSACGEVVEEKRGESPVCASACGSHQVCAFVNDITAEAACTCAPGYADTSGVCLWQGGGVNGGGLRDGKLNDPSAWEATLIDHNPTAFSSDNGSVAFRTAFGLCGESVLRQKLDMPEYKDAEPFVLEVEYLSQAPQGQTDGEAVIRWNGSDTIVPFQGRNGTIRMCLGANAYGRDVTFELVPLINPYACNSGDEPPPSRLFRSFAIKPAAPNECAAPGALVNSSFTANTDGWTFSTRNTRVATPNGELRVAATAGYGEITASTSISIPSKAALPNPALRFRYYTALGNADYGNATRYVRHIDIRMNNQLLASRYPTDGAPAALATICLPEWSQGMAYGLSFIGGSPSNTLFPEGPTDYYYMFLDDVEVISDNSCTFDGGFERAANQSSWIFDKGTFPRVPLNPGFVNNATLAHSGNALIDFEPARDTGYHSLTLERWMKVPAISGNAKPVLKFWHRAVALAPFTLTTLPATAVTAPTATWSEQSMCLNPRSAGHLQLFRWSIGANADAAVHHYYLDDVELTTSTTCP